MTIIQCTEKLRKEMGLKDPSLVIVQSAGTVLSTWHANLIYIGRKKCVLFVNDMTRFNFIVTDVNRPYIRELGKMFLCNLHPVLVQEGFTSEQRDKIIQESEGIHFAKTSSKSVLGSMNDLTFHYGHCILEAGDLHSHEVPEIIRRLNRMPMGMLEFAYPVEALRAAIANNL